MKPEEVSDHLQSRFQEVDSLAEKFVETINEYADLMAQLLEVVRCERIPNKTKLLLILQQHGSKKDLKDKIDYLKSQIEEDDRKLSWSIRSIQDSLENKCFKCETCGGSGKVSKTQIVRDRDMIQPYLTSEDCPTCRGKGVFTIPRQIEGYMILLVRMAIRAGELGKTFIKISQENINLLATEKQ